jgi:hypothetical protein
VHINMPLTNISVAYAAEFPSIADAVFPVVEVMKRSDKYYIYDLADWNRVSIEPRAPSTESAGVDWRLSNDQYYCNSYALHKDIAYEERENADSVLDLDSDAVNFLVRKMRLVRDKLWARDFFTTGVWTGSTTGSDIAVANEWNATNSTPIAEIRAEIRSVHTRTGHKPNTLVLGAPVWDALQDNADFLSRIKNTSDQIVTKDLLARVLEIDKVIVGEVMEATSVEGAATTTTAQMFGDGALLLYVPPRPGRQVASAGYQFRWKVNGIPNQTVKKMNIPLLNSDRLEIQTSLDFKQVSPRLGVFFTSILS